MGGTKLFDNAMFIRFNHIISTFVEKKIKANMLPCLCQPQFSVKTL